MFVFKIGLPIALVFIGVCLAVVGAAILLGAITTGSIAYSYGTGAARSRKRSRLRATLAAIGSCLRRCRARPLFLAALPRFGAGAACSKVEKKRHGCAINARSLRGRA